MNKWSLFLIAFFLNTQINAGAIQFLGSTPLKITTETHGPLSSSLISAEETVFVQHVQLSPKAHQGLIQRIEQSQDQDMNDSSRYSVTKLPEHINLGMNDTPVLDQGEHGSCVTFAVTGALDAVIGEGDYVSQLCSLELGEYLEKKNQVPYSGWDGSLGDVVLKEFEDYGIVPKSYQVKYGCAGIKGYTASNPSKTGRPMTLSEYIANAFPLGDYATWTTLLEAEESFTTNHNPSAFVREVKKQLSLGHRVVFGVLLDDTDGDVGAMGTYKKKNDSWIVTPEILRHAKNKGLEAGHELIITGYDDNATIKSKKGKVSKGMFILRNSWGSKAGDKGTYYMSYAYFKAFTDEAFAILPVQKNN